MILKYRTLLFSALLFSSFVFGTGVVSADGNNLISNPTFSPDPSNTAVPLNWRFSVFGNNNGQAVYPAEGSRAGQTALKTVITSYTDGFADWFSDPVPVTQLSQYRYTEKYNSDSTGVIEAEYTIAGSQVPSYVDIGFTNPTGGAWQSADITFLAPPNATSVRFYHLLNKAGSLSVAEPSLTLSSSGDTTFSKGMVSLSFDDGTQTQYDKAFPALNTAGFKGTFYIVSDFMKMADSIGTSTGDVNNNYMNSSEVEALSQAGHEIGNHTASHCNLVTGLCPDAEANNSKDPLTPSQEMGQASSTLKSFDLGSVDTLAYPYGSYNSDVANTARNQNFLVARSVDRGYNQPISDPYSLKIQYMGSTLQTTADFQNTVKPWIDEAVANHLWLILLFHQIEPSSTIAQTHDPDAVTPEMMQMVIDYLKQNNVSVVTVHEGACMMTNNKQDPRCSGGPTPVPQNVSVTLGNLSQVYDGQPKTVSVSTTPAGMNVVLTYNGTTTPPVSAGSYAVEASARGQGSSGSATGTLVISKAEQKISFPAIGNKVIGANDFPISATSTSGLSVVFKTGDSSVCTITGSIIHLVSTGNCSVEASQAGDQNWNTAPAVSQTFNVGNVLNSNTAPSITILGNNPATTTVGQVYHDSGATAFDSEDGDLTLYVIASSTVDQGKAGTYSVTYNVTDKGGLSSSAQRVVKVLPASGGGSGQGGASKGKITFCTMFSDWNNNLVLRRDSLPVGNFEMSITKEGSSDFGTTTGTWDSSGFNPNTVLINDRRSDADCRSLEVPFGTYHYSGKMTGDMLVWNEPKYDDGETHAVNNIFDFGPYKVDDSNFPESDGKVTVDSNRMERRIVALVSYRDPSLARAPHISGQSSVSGTVGHPLSYSFSVTPTYETSPFEVSVSSLPSGLQFASTTLLISGTPQQPGNFSISITARNIYGTDSKNVLMTFGADNGTTTIPASNPPSTATSTDSGGRDSRGDQSPVSTSGSGGSAYSIVGNGPPVGLITGAQTAVVAYEPPSVLSPTATHSDIALSNTNSPSEARVENSVSGGSASPVEEKIIERENRLALAVTNEPRETSSSTVTSIRSGGSMEKQLADIGSTVGSRLSDNLVTRLMEFSLFLLSLVVLYFFQTRKRGEMTTNL